jgi:Na+/H+ antiporter NhaD/arsenite permease-like protein
LFGDYIPFIVLLLSLYVVTGGIHLSGDIKAKPWVNTLFLGIGWVLASFMGTTGAAMLLIRPLLATNQQRQHKVHTVLFFIALCANCGGLLTPLGDPPLFMLFLRGAEFTWFASMWGPWLLTGVLLLIIYYLLDTYYYKREHWTSISADHREHTPLKIEGCVNLLYLLGIVLTVAFVNEGVIPEMGEEHAPMWIKYMREIVLLSLAGLSYYTTSKKLRFVKNKFSWAPIVEVAVLFLGIFTTMTPALAYLNDNAASLGLSETWQFYYMSGALSSFLDNTPTAVAFHSVASGLTPEQMLAFGENFMAGIPELLLKAICMGSVFFGAMTYIGNGPNFMVKAIAEENGVKMPSFFGYMFKFSLIVLLPIYILVQLIFL